MTTDIMALVNMTTLVWSGIQFYNTLVKKSTVIELLLL